MTRFGWKSRIRSPRASAWMPSPTSAGCASATKKFMSRRVDHWLLIAAAWIVGYAAGVAAAAPRSHEATISSDEMELLNNGAKTIFTGHVILEQKPYVLKADRMAQEKGS